MIYQVFPTIISGTITGLRISNVASYYFLDNLPADVLRFAGSGNEMHISDGTKTKKVLLGALGTGETLGGELLADSAFDADASWDIKDVGWTVSSGLATATALGDNKKIWQSNVAAGVGQLRKQVIVCDSLIGTYRHGIDRAQICANQATVGASTAYRTLLNTTNASSGIFSAGSLAGTFSSITQKQVLTPSTSGLWYTPVSEESGWDPNAATHTYRVLATKKIARPIRYMGVSVHHV
jgi:hypothetical protein